MVEDPVASTPEPRAAAAARFRAQYEQHFEYVFRTLRRLGVAERDLDDLCHDVFVVLFRGDGYDARRPLRPWLFGVAFRVASDHRRRAGNRLEIPSPPDAHDVDDGRPAPDEQLLAAERRRLVHLGLEALDLERRAIFVMHELEGHAMPEIADALGVPLNTCYSRLRLAREQFAVAVRRHPAADRPAAPAPGGRSGPKEGL